jgi:hypothetical protein
MRQGALAPSDGNRAGHGWLEYRAYTEVRVSSRSCTHLLVATSAADGPERGELRASAPLASRCRSPVRSGEIRVTARKRVHIDDAQQLVCIHPAMDAFADEPPSLLIPCIAQAARTLAGRLPLQGSDSATLRRASPVAGDLGSR